MIFEDLVRSPEDYLKNILKFIGEDKMIKHDMTVKPAPSNLYNELLRYINILAKIITLLGFDNFYKKIFVNSNLPSRRFRKFFTIWGITLDEKVFKKTWYYGNYQYGFKGVLQNIENTYAANNKKLSNLIGKGLLYISIRVYKIVKFFFNYSSILSLFFPFQCYDIPQ